LYQRHLADERLESILDPCWSSALHAIVTITAYSFHFSTIHFDETWQVGIPSEYKLGKLDILFE